MARERYGAKFLEREPVTNKLAKFRFEVQGNGNGIYKFRPGEFSFLVWKPSGGKPIVRAYSNASSPGRLPIIEYFMKHVTSGGKRPDGKGIMTTSLFEMGEGELRESKFLIQAAPEKKYELNPDKAKGRRILMVSAGTGVAAYPGIVDWLVESGRGLDGHVVVHGTRACEDLSAYSGKFESFREKGLQFERVTSRIKCDETDADYVGELFFDRAGRTGRVNLEENAGEIDIALENGRHKGARIEGILGEPLNRTKHMVMLCGPPDMIKNMEQILTKGHGFVKGEDVLSEKFW